MKPSRYGIGLIALAFVFAPVVASPVIFTTDTLIAPLDSTYDELETARGFGYRWRKPS